MDDRSRVVIFGNGQMAEFAWARLTEADPEAVVGFTVDRSHRLETSLRGLPVVAFDELVQHFPPATHRIFIAVGPVQCNRIRAERFEQARALGYRFVRYVSPNARLGRDVTMGENVSIGDGAVIQAFARLGENVHVGAGCIVGHHSDVRDHCFLAPGCIVSGSVSIGERSFIGSNATIRDRLEIGRASVVGAGASIMRNTGPNSVHVAPEAVLLPIDSGEVRF